ncbi:MAG: hypothetical protein M1142_02085 [Patescibacteria group bacterium]|nr:hypothetical protein [Patescibacteria group bacterium]
MRKTLEVRIGPVPNFAGAIDVTTTEETKERFLHTGDLGAMVDWAKWKNRFKIGISLILAADAATELSKSIFPLISADLIPLNNYPILAQLSLYSETQLGVGILAAIGTYYLGKDTFRDRRRLQTMGAALRKIQISSVEFQEPIENQDENKPQS